MDCRVVVEAAVPVYDVQTEDDAVRIAISKTGEMLNPDLNYVEISMGQRHCPHCGESVKPAFVAADESLVALELEMMVFNVERDEHAKRIARKEIGQRLEDIPLEVLSVETIESATEEDDGGETGGEDDGETGDEDEMNSGEDDGESGGDDNMNAGGNDGMDARDEEGVHTGDDGNDVVPSVDEMLDDEDQN